MKPVIYIDQCGQVMFIKDCPEEPSKRCAGKPFCCDGERCKWLVYHEALAAAKQSAILFEDQNLAATLVDRNLIIDWLPKDSIHPFPSDQYKVEIKRRPIGFSQYDFEQVALLSLKPQEDKLISEPKDMKEIKDYLDYSGPLKQEWLLLKQKLESSPLPSKVEAFTLDEMRGKMISLLDWYDKLSPSSRVSVWSKDGECSGLFTMDSEQLVDKFLSIKDKNQ